MGFPIGKKLFYFVVNPGPAPSPDTKMAAKVVTIVLRAVTIYP